MEKLQLDTNQLISACKHLYRMCAIDLGVDAQQLSQISMAAFVKWCVEHDEPVRSTKLMITKLGLTPQGVTAIDRIFNGDPWACASILFPIWYVVVMSHRPPISNSIHFVHVAYTVGFRDGKVAQMQGVKEMAPGMVNTDGFLCAFMRDQTDHMLQQLCSMGFDKLHDDYSVIPSEGPTTTPRQQFPDPPPGKIGW